ncbi:MAG: DUF779 domain-containing protein [Brachymonas sp.]|nr:DUF779 domain-containing protein [Brachymonas sp.]
MVERIVATPAAIELIRALELQHGSLMFHQSGGCCDNSAANCYLPTDLTIGVWDVKLGEVAGVPFYISKQQFETWKHTQLILDVVDGLGGTFSLETGTGKAFHTRSRVFTPEEQAWLDAHPPEEGAPPA